MKPMTRWTGSLQSRREFDAFYTWGQRAGLWALVSGGGFAVLAVLLYGPGPLPQGVHVPWWVAGSIVAFIGLPFSYMLGVAFAHLVRADRALRREAKDGQVTYANRVAQWIYTHGLLVGLVLVGLVVAASTWWTLHRPS